MWSKSSKLTCTVVQEYFRKETKFLSTSVTLNKKHSCKLLIVGGGSGGCSVAAKYAAKLGKGNVTIIEPSEKHYYQPMFTMIGGGMKKLEDSVRPMKSVLPKNAFWLKDYAVKFDPAKNQVITKDGDTVEYEFMIVAMGLQLNFNEVDGLVNALKTPGVCSNYSPEYVTKTYEELKKFKEGNAIFTFPNTPVKCAGAPQKIMYIAEHYFRKNGKRDKANIIYNTSLPVIFGVKKYAEALMKVCEQRNIKVNLRHNLIKVIPDKKEAVFENLDLPGTHLKLKYSLLHVSPPMSSPKELKECKELVDSTGFLDVSKDTLQHKKYDNIFGIGDCTNLPTSKTGAAVASQLKTLRMNLDARMKNDKLPSSYLGYTSCPLVTGYNSCILAEFDYNGQPLETFPLDQSKERLTMFLMKKYVMPELYWHLMLRMTNEELKNLMEMCYAQRFRINIITNIRGMKAIRPLGTLGRTGSISQNIALGVLLKTFIDLNWRNSRLYSGILLLHILALGRSACGEIVPAVTALAEVLPCDTQPIVGLLSIFCVT